MIAQNQERLSVHYMDIQPYLYQEFLQYNNKKMKYLKMKGMARIFPSYTK